MMENTVLAEEGLVDGERDKTDSCYSEGTDALGRAPLVLIASPASQIK